MPPPQKSPAKYTALDMPVVGQNATCLADLLNALKEEYLYNTRNLLRTARKAGMRAAKRQLDAAGHQPPFTKPSESDSGQYIRFAVEVFDSNATITNRKTIAGQSYVTPKVEGVPRYKDFNTIRKNHHVKDEEVLRYVPYFGETDDIDLAEVYKIDVRSPEEEEEIERAKSLLRIIDRAMELSHLTMEQVIKAIEEPAKTSETLNAKVQKFIDEWAEATGISIEFLLEVREKKSPLDTHQSPQRGVKPVQEDPIETYRFLSCPICTTHDCCFHDIDRCEFLPHVVDESTPYPENEPCGDDCFLHQIQVSKAMTDTGTWTDEDLSLLEACVRIQGRVERISCLAALGLGKRCDKVYAKLAQKDLLPLPLTTTTTTTMTTVTTVTTTVSEQSRPSSSSRQSRSNSIDSSTTAQKSVHAQKKRKTGHSNSKGSKKEGKWEYPADCNLSADNEKRGRFSPCDHEGPCGPDCSCVQDQVHCEKACACPPDCPRRWRGCSCKRGGACGTWSCECYKWSRECDTDLCGSCHAGEVLDPVNLAKERNGEIFEGGCANVCIQRGMTKRTLMGRSAIAGWGLFAGEKIKAGQFLGEYKGEIIGNEESERRGLLYDKKGVSFLFTLNKDQVVDATRAANKFRFVNHSRRDPNCYAKISFVNGVHRIGMYAKTDLYPGQELFFDYGYNSKSTKFVPLEHQLARKDSKVRVKLAGRGTRGSSKTKQRAPSLQRVDKQESDEEETEGDHETESFADSEDSY